MACKVNYVNVSPGRSGTPEGVPPPSGMEVTRSLLKKQKSPHLVPPCIRLLQHSVRGGARQRGDHRFRPGLRVKGGQRQARTSACGESADVAEVLCWASGQERGHLFIIITTLEERWMCVPSADGPSGQQHMKKQKTGQGSSLHRLAEAALPKEYPQFIQLCPLCYEWFLVLQ